MNVVTITSSKDSPNASSAPATSADAQLRQRHERNVSNGCAPRSALASSNERDMRRSRATALLNTTTTQNVAWPTITVNRPSCDAERRQHLPERRVERHAGDDARQRERQQDEERHGVAAEEVEAATRPARRASRARSAIAVAPSPACTDVHSASRTPGLSTALPNHSQRQPVERPALRAALVEGVQDDHEDRHVDERQHQRRWRSAGRSGCRGRGTRPQRFSNAPRRRASRR